MVSKALDIHTRHLPPFSTETVRLILEWSPEHLHVVLWDRKAGKPLALETYHGRIDNEDAWEAALQQSVLLAFRDVEVDFVVAGARALPVPLTLADPARAASELDLAYGAPGGMHTGGEMVDKAGLVLYWQVPGQLYQLVNQHFTVVQWRHVAGEAIRRTLGKENSPAEVIIYHQHAWVVLAREGRLLYAWSIPFAGADDLAWQLLTLCNQWGQGESVWQWTISGMCSPDAPLYRGFSQFLHQVTMAGQGLSWSEEVPASYLAHLSPPAGS